VTRLGEFLPDWELFTLGSLMKIIEVAYINTWGTLFSSKIVMY
jgi:hypothetical protein